LFENIPAQETSNRRVDDDIKNLKEKKEYKKKYLNSKLESCQQSLKSYKLAGKISINIYFYIT
jgi:guanylate kinase